MMKRLINGRIVIAPRVHEKPRVLGESRRPGFFVKAALLLGIALCLVLSVIFTMRAGETKDILASGSTALPPDGNRIDASGMESVFEQSVVDPRLILGTEMPMIYGVTIEEIEISEQSETQAPQTDIYFDVLPDDIKLEILGFADDAPKEFHLAAGGPQILIYHTHTTEAYRQITGQEYVETGSWRTADENKSIVAVGDVLQKELEALGYNVIHDTTDHEPPELNSAYSRSLETMEQYEANYPTIRVFIDVHRDAYNDVEAGASDYITVNGEECARVMFVVGTGEKYSVKPNYESNYKLALAITNELEKIQKGFTRPIRVKTGRYNQQVSDMCVLIEVGHNANSLEQAMNSAKYVALAISRVIEQQ